MSVKFTFSIDGDVFTVDRITRQNGPAQARLSCEARGIAIQQADNVTNAITRALCMDDEAFLHTVLLPQGLHARLLMSTQGIRNDILAELFNLSRLPVVEGYVRSLEARVGATLAEIDVQRRRFGDDPAAEVSRATDELKLYEANAAKAKAAAERVSALDEQLRKGVSTLAQHEEDEQILARATEA
jgi:DNA repair exonuclease SbcCD ATPase subunit